MQPIRSLQGQLFVNENPVQPKHKAVDPVKQQDTYQSTTNDFVKSATETTEAVLEQVFARADTYAGISSSAQKSLEAYHQVEINHKREVVKTLLGVDLYA
ncbi:hypothetical protein [Glaciecola sp. 1036]|uniref:hypothetical protein n=1 Tax=Alteromonadaceae TaxID=72275 RepID=UPI003D037BB0